MGLKLIDSLWKKGRVFSEYEAAIDYCVKANRKSALALSNRWQWNLKKVEALLAKINSDPECLEYMDKNTEAEYIRKASKTDKEKFDKFLSWFNEKLKTNYQRTEKVWGQFHARSKTYDPSDFQKVLKAILADNYHKETSFKYVTPEYMLRPDIFERYRNMKLESDQEGDKNRAKGVKL